MKVALVEIDADLPPTQSSEDHSRSCPFYSGQLSLADVRYLKDFRYLPMGIPFAVLRRLGTLPARRILL